jgi:hypothetical protein
VFERWRQLSNGASSNESHSKAFTCGFIVAFSKSAKAFTLIIYRLLLPRPQPNFAYFFVSNQSRLPLGKVLVAQAPGLERRIIRKQAQIAGDIGCR